MLACSLGLPRVLRSSDMVVRSIGNSLMVILPDLVGNKITNWFDLVRPLVAFQFQKVSRRLRNNWAWRHGQGAQ